MRLAGGAQKGNKIAQRLGRQVAKLPRVALADRFLQIAQEGDSRDGDANTDDAAVVGGAVALDQAPFYQFIKQAGDIGSARYEPAGQVERADFSRVFATEQAQGVVLLRSQVMDGEQLVFERPQSVVRAPQAQEGLLFERVEVATGLCRMGAWWSWNQRGHIERIRLPTTVVQTSV